MKQIFTVILCFFMSISAYSQVAGSCVLSIHMNPHLIGETRTYSVGMSSAYTFEWTVSPNATYTTTSSGNAINVTLHSGGDLCISVKARKDRNVVCQTSSCYQTDCNFQAMSIFHGEITHSIVGNKLTLSTSNYDPSNYYYLWDIYYLNSTPPIEGSKSGHIVEYDIPRCSDNAIQELYVSIFYKQDDTCVVKKKITFNNLCSGGLNPDLRSKLNVLFDKNNNTLIIEHIDFEKKSIIVFDNSGNQVFSGKLESKLYLNNLKSGIYYYKILGNNQEEISNGKFIK